MATKSKAVRTIPTIVGSSQNSIATPPAPEIRAAQQKPAGIFAFGSRAERYARGLPPEISAIICDGTESERALAQAAALRRAGKSFFVAPILSHDRAEIAFQAATLLMEKFQDPDALRLHFEALSNNNLTLNKQNLFQALAMPGRIVHTMRDLFQMGDALLVRSQAERLRLESLFQRKRPHVAVAAGNDLNVPNVSARSEARGILVWAPERRANELAMFFYAFANERSPITFVCQGHIADTHFRFVDPVNADSELFNTAVIVDAQTSDPSTAIAFAQRGFAIVAAATSGAGEYLNGISLYDPANFLSIRGAIGRALALRNPQAVDHADSPRTLTNIAVASQPPRLDVTPLVTIVVPTYNRRDYLRRSLQSYSKQTYPNFEILVVNDCGEDVADIVAEYSFARLIATDVNVGCVNAINTGFRHARGELLGAVADDDLIYPDHIARCVAAIQYSGREVAYTNIIIRLDCTDENLGLLTYGYTLIHDADHDSEAVLWGGSCTHALGYLATRHAWETVGYFNPERKLASDMDSILAFSRHFEFVHVPYVTGEMSYRNDKTNSSARAGLTLVDQIADVLHHYLPANRPLLRARAQQNLELIAQGQQMDCFFEPAIRLSPPIPIT